MRLPFPPEYRQRYYNLLEEIFESNFWTEGLVLDRFESEFSNYTGMPSVAFTNAGVSLYALFKYAAVADHEVILPANTFYATTIAARMAGANIVYADCNKFDLCISLQDIKTKLTRNTKAVCVVHIGGHIAFEIEEIADFCLENNLELIEDCSHAHGARYKGLSPGSWGLGGAYSFYATKTMPLGEGGMVCSTNPKLIDWLKHFRNYGKNVQDGSVSYVMDQGFNGRMNEFTAALGVIQLERIPGILEWKRNLAAKLDQIFENRVLLPEGMVSGYYKYVVFGYELLEETGKVFSLSDFGPEIDKLTYRLPNSRWVAKNHNCVPIWYGWDHHDKSVEALQAILIR